MTEDLLLVNDPAHRATLREWQGVMIEPALILNVLLDALERAEGEITELRAEALNRYAHANSIHNCQWDGTEGCEYV